MHTRFGLRTGGKRAQKMASWTITITAPTGAFDATLHLSEDGDGTAGEMVGKNGKGPMLDLRLDAAAISWSTKVERPMPMKLKFQGIIDGDAMSGTVKFGIFASGTFSGTRGA
jgi:hypothetical protein